jgi:rhodanese-related sulfurtransferase
MLASARSLLGKRLTPREAFDSDALLVDIRPQHQRAAEDEIPGALLVERNVLEWRFDLTDEWHLPEVFSHAQPIVVVCSEGYTSSLAAAALQELGFSQATDIIGGFLAWRDAGLPTQPGGGLPLP